MMTSHLHVYYEAVDDQSIVDFSKLTKATFLFSTRKTLRAVNIAAPDPSSCLLLLTTDIDEFHVVHGDVITAILGPAALEVCMIVPLLSR